MIPFWKKTGKHSKPQSAQKRRQNAKAAVPRTAQQSIPMQRMLNQANGDRQILAKQLNISPHQLSYVTHSGEGEGLLFFGNVILPFVDRFPTDLELYRIMTTKLGEVSEVAQK